MPAPKKVTHIDAVSDTTKLTATASVDPELLQAITNSEHGFMRAGAMPTVTAASAGGTKTLLDAVAKAIVLSKTDWSQSFFEIWKCPSHQQQVAYSCT